MLALLNIGFFEMVLLAAAAVLLFGGDLPDVARKAARFVGKLRALSNDLTRELHTDDLSRHPGLRRPPELQRPPELDLRPDERRLFDGKLSERPRSPLDQAPHDPQDAELGPPRDAGVADPASTSAAGGDADGAATATDTAGESRAAAATDTAGGSGAAAATDTAGDSGAAAATDTAGGSGAAAATDTETDAVAKRERSRPTAEPTAPVGQAHDEPADGSAVPGEPGEPADDERA